MDALTLLRHQATQTHSLLQQVIRDLTPPQATWTLAGSTNNPIGAILLHALGSEDYIVRRMQGRPPQFAGDGWRERIGLDPTEAFSAATPPDLAALREYLEAVHAVTRAYLEQVEPATLADEVDTAGGRGQRGLALSLVLVTHKLTHLGEVAALLGSQGVKGFPF